MKYVDTEVLVVGGGPAGAATATWLARAGHDVVLVDKARFPRPKPCGEFFSPGAVAALQRLGALDAVTIWPHSRPVGMRALTQDGDSFLVSYQDSPVVGKENGGLAVDRTLFDAALIEYACTTGVRVVEGVHVLGVIAVDGHVTGVRVRRREGTGEITARFVVGADGSSSAIARSLGLNRHVSWPRRLGLAAHYTGVELEGREGEMHMGKDLYCGVASLGEGLVSVGLAAPMGSKRPGESADALLDRLLDRLPTAASRLAGGWRVSPVRGVGPLVRRVSRVGGPGFLLVGDAAGFFDPLTGEGVHRALIGAEKAWKAVVLALDRDDRFPVGYERSRRMAFAAKERVVFLMQALLGRPAALSYLLRRLDRRAAVGELLSGVIGDYRHARSVLAPWFLWGLLSP